MRKLENSPERPNLPQSTQPKLYYPLHPNKSTRSPITIGKPKEGRSAPPVPIPLVSVSLKFICSFANTDYALCRSLSEASKLWFIKVTYDIWCQYHVNLEPRVEELFNNMLLILRRIRDAIPKMHIHNHQDLCEILWNLDWLPNCGLTWARWSRPVRLSKTSLPVVRRSRTTAIGMTRLTTRVDTGIGTS
jgi:hypothetical protein